MCRKARRGLPAKVSSVPHTKGVEPLRTAIEQHRLEFDDSRWRALRYFNIYRLAIGCLFAGLTLVWRLQPEVLSVHIPLSGWTAMFYIAFALLFYAAVLRRAGGFIFLRNVQVAADVLALTLFIHATGGVSGGFGILLAVANAGSCLLSGRKQAVVNASVSTVALLGETLYGIWRLDYPTACYVQAALIGTSSFLTGVLSAWLSEQVRISALLVAEREAEVRSLASLNSYVVQRMQSGILVLDGSQHVVLTNQAALRMVGLAAPAIGLALHEFSGMLNLAWRAWRQRGDNRRTPLTLDTAGAEVIVSFYQIGEDPSGTLVFMDDAAEIHQRAQQIKLASLGRLTASIAHEIRNPLGAISHAGQLLSESAALPPDDRRLVQIIEEHSLRMNDIVKNVLMIGRRDNPNAERFELLPWLQAFMDEFARRHGLDPDALTVQTTHADIIVTMDKSQLQQVLWNLGENALRYSQRRPWLSFRVRRDETQGRIFLDVVDTGPGMTAVVAEQLFEPFFTTEGAGTGLGLYIARELCEANQTNLTLWEQGPEGCVFRLSFTPPEFTAALH